VGANMIFRRDVLRELGGFEARLGRVGTSLISNEETHLRDRVAALGYRCFYAPRAIVHHHISRDRLTPEYIRRRLLAQGESDVIGASLASRPVGLVGRLAGCLLDAARVGKHTVRSWCQRGERAAYSRQLAVVSLGRFRASLRHVWRRSGSGVASHLGLA
jgi:GT2 family glycosyltransferase